MTDADRHALAPLDIAGRLPRLRARARRRGHRRAARHAAAPNVRYLTGFTGSAGDRCSSRADDALFVTDGRYRTQSARAARRRRRRRARSRSALTVADAARRRSPPRSRRRARLGLEAHAVTWAAAARASPSAFAGRRARPDRHGLVEELRRVKDAGEVARIRAACAIADDALAALLPRLADGPTEREFALDARVRDARAGRERQQLRPDHRVGPERREAARPPDATASIEPQRARRHRLRLHRRRLLLRHDAHRVASAIPGPTRATSTTSCSRASRPGATRSRAGVDVRRRRPRVAAT